MLVAEAQCVGQLPMTMRRQFGSFDTLVPPNFSTTQDGSTGMFMMSSAN